MPTGLPFSTTGTRAVDAVLASSRAGYRSAPRYPGPQAQTPGGQHANRPAPADHRRGASWL